MGAMNGVEAAMEILGVLPLCKVFFISGNVCCDDLLEKARAKGFDFEVLQKPLPPPEMLARVEQICSQSNLPRSNGTTRELRERTDRCTGVFLPRTHVHP